MSILSAIAPAPALPPQLITADEFVRRYENARAELVKGQVVELPVAQQKHGKICANCVRYFGNHASDRDCGHVTSNDSFVLTRKDPDSVRGADICYFSYERIPKGEFPEGLLPISPDMTVEVRSPSDRWTQVFAKVIEYLEAGVRVVIVLDSATATASVYRPDELQQIFDNGDLLVVPDVLPGFSVPVKKLFE